MGELLLLCKLGLKSGEGFVRLLMGGEYEGDEGILSGFIRRGGGV